MFFILFTNFLSIAIAQQWNHLSPEIPYRSSQNQYYWKNRIHNPIYWQQDVHYTINALIDDETDIISGDYQLVYWNNSPFPLKELFFHLHQNAFQPNSYYDNLNKNNNVKVKFGKYEQQGLGTSCDSIRINNKPAMVELDNTIMKIPLFETLKSGDSIVITMKFKTYFDTGTMRRRMKKFDSFNTKHFDGVQWYPAIAVYDAKFGWNTDQDLDKEYYGDFGVFDVKLTFPQEYIVEATGVLQNKEEVMPDSLRKKLDLSNFVKKSPAEPISQIIAKEKGKTKTWYFHAKNVHNFAFTADPLYRISELEWNGIKVIALAQENHAAGWQQSAMFTMNVIKVYSKDFGMYAWPKIIVADAKDGMEYPMLTLDGGTYPQHQGLLAHEVGHMWFYGMLGSNETYRAYLDEGFTQFLTVWSMDRIVGEKRARFHKNKYISKYLDSSDTRYENLYYPYLNHVNEGFDEQLNTHSSAFNGAIRHGGNYGLVYYKTGVMLYNLRYVLGEELFLNAMKYYVEKWKFKHPYPEDFRQSIIEYTQVDLNWFFDQWLETNKSIDYGIEKVKRISKNNNYEITFSRKGRMQMPIDFTVIDEQDVKHNYHIPNTWFTKQTQATVLPKWYGWDLLQPTYTATVNIPNKIKSIEIDPEKYLADADLRNNKVGEGGICSFEFDHRVPSMPSWTRAKNFWRPDVWYNSYDGLQLGLHAEGAYLNKNTYSISAWYNSRLLQNNVFGDLSNKNQPVAFEIFNKNSTNKIWHNSNLSQHSFYNAGVTKVALNFEKIFRTQDTRNPRYSKLFAELKYLVNAQNIAPYLLFPSNWAMNNQNTNNANYINASFNIGYSKYYVYEKGNGELTFTVRTPAPKSSYNYSYLLLNSLNKINWKKFEIKSRIFGQWIFGDEIPSASALYLAGANPEALIENKFTRARGFVPDQWMGYGANTNHFHAGGGLNLRGYAGYWAVQENNGILNTSYIGKGGASYNIEIDFDKYFKIPAKGITKNLKVDTYFFGDIGTIAYNFEKKTYPSALRMDAGIGTSVTIKFSPLDIKPLVIRFDMPLWLNTPPATEEYFQFRYLVGINRAF
ncbi:MAG: M1 family peptidase [Cytophagales bacterium]|nr:MAG: M1 family peptidase [Cytophagales bacterium]